MDKIKAYEVLKNDGHEHVVFIEKKADYFLGKHSHDFEVDIIIVSGHLEIGLSNSNIILFPGSRFKLEKGELHTERAGHEGVSFYSARPIE